MNIVEEMLALTAQEPQLSPVETLRKISDYVAKHVPLLEGAADEFPSAANTKAVAMLNMLNAQTQAVLASLPRDIQSTRYELTQYYEDGTMAGNVVGWFEEVGHRPILVGDEIVVGLDHYLRVAERVWVAESNDLIISLTSKYRGEEDLKDLRGDLLALGWDIGKE
ncbi:hypothetical protein [Hymenobacter koreensis]|uniref:Uncharacterized protein n=1 Tax=Hymenobacter koreensis TaxID=1084523 RepID=A0ABP8JKA6_9BACT